MELCDIYDIPFLLQALRVLRVRQPGDNTDSPYPTTYLNNQVKAGQRSTTEVKVRGVEKNQGQLMNVMDTFLSRDCSWQKYLYSISESNIDKYVYIIMEK